MGKENEAYTYSEIFFSLKRKKKEVLSHATTCRNLEGTAPGETDQFPKDKYHTVPLI